MADYPRPGYYSAPDHVKAAARNAARQAVLDMVPQPRSETAAPASSPESDRLRSTAEQQPLTVLEAAAELEKAARDLVSEHLRIARQAGRTWYQIADALHLHAVAVFNKESAADEAYSFARNYIPYADHRDFIWSCPACQQPITDHGPWDDVPRQEDGHEADCSRRTAQLAAWKACNSDW